jgi:hypothetical protein
VLLNVRVANVEVTASGSHAFNGFLLFSEVDVSFVAEHSLGLVERLSETTGHSEGVRTSGSSHVGVLAFEGLCVDSNWSGLSVITSGDASTELGVTILSRAAVHTGLNNELLVTMFHGNEFTVLSTHDLSTNNVAREILLVVSCSICGVKVADLTLAGLLVSLGLLLGHNLRNNSGFEILSLATRPGNLIGGVLACSVVKASGAHNFRLGLTVDTVSCVVENFIGINWVLKVQVLLRDVLSDNGSKGKVSS